MSSLTPRRRFINASARAVTPTGVRNSAEPSYARETTTTEIHDRLGNGQRLTVRCLDGKGQLDFEQRVSVYRDRPLLVIEVVGHNPSSSTPLPLRSLEPIHAAAIDSGGCIRTRARKVLTNGFLYSDPGRVLDMAPGQRIQSWWNIALHSDKPGESLVVGYLENRTSLGQVSVMIEEPSAVSLTAASQYQREFAVAPGGSVSSDPVALVFGPNSHAALETYGHLLGELRQNRLNPPINGWCSWFSFYGEITEEEVVRQSEFVAKHLKLFGCEWIQLDDGFYRAFGDWDGNKRFPHGMKWLAQKIRSLGLKPGIWFAPYVIAEGTEVHDRHPDWLVRDADGQPKLISSAEAKPKLYALDISHPGGGEWLRHFFRTAAEDWGYDMFKIDFVEWSILAADRYHDPAATKASVYRRGFEIMRQAIGPHRHLLDCGPGNTTIGLLDSMRIELDQPPLNWKQYFLTPASSAPAAAKRYYFHQNAWINDVDHIGLAYCTIPQAQAVATIIALSGGNTIAGDRLTDLDPIRLEILKKAFPSATAAARPIDLFERERPEIFALPIKRPFGQWLVLGLFNSDEKEGSEKKVELADLGLDPAKTYLGFDFWNQRFFGELRQRFQVHLEPSSVLLLSLQEHLGRPQFLSTDRHIAQGAVELETVTWDADKQIIAGVCLGAPGMEYSVYLYLPEKHPWRQHDPFFYYDFPGYTLHLPDPQLLRLHLHFGQEARVPWAVDIKQLFSS